MLFRDLGVPRSTAASWIRRDQRPVVSAQVLALDQLELQAEVLALERRIKFLLAIIRLAFLLVRLSGFRRHQHVPDRASKRSILVSGDGKKLFATAPDFVCRCGLKEHRRFKLHTSRCSTQDPDLFQA